jgi:hypothetical protein
MSDLTTTSAGSQNRYVTCELESNCASFSTEVAISEAWRLDREDALFGSPLGHLHLIDIFFMAGLTWPLSLTKLSPVNMNIALYSAYLLHIQCLRSYNE